MPCPDTPPTKSSISRLQTFPDHQFTPRSIGIDFYGDALFTSENLLKKNPKLVAAFREASLRGWRYALTHEDELIDLIIAKYTRRHGPEHLRFEAAETTRLMQPDLVEVGEMKSAPLAEDRRHLCRSRADHVRLRSRRIHLRSTADSAASLV